MMRSQEVVEEEGEKKRKELTVRRRASAVSDAGSGTFGRSGPEFYLPSEEETHT